jgi:hypothetical protein
MPISTKAIVGTLVLVLLIGAGYAFAVSGGFSSTQNTVATSTPTTTTTDTPAQTAQSTSVKIALLDTTGSGTGKARGCDTVTMATRSITATTSVLTAAMQTLFSEPAGTQPSQAYNFIARTNKTLKFDHATIVNGTANIYLTGALSGLAGVCDDPRAQIQIEETALQFATVQKVGIYLNNKLTTLTPNEKGE